MAGSEPSLGFFTFGSLQGKVIKAPPASLIWDLHQQEIKNVFSKPRQEDEDNEPLVSKVCQDECLASEVACKEDIGQVLLPGAGHSKFSNDPK